MPAMRWKHLRQRRSPVEAVFFSPAGPCYAQAQLGLARAYVMAGDKGNAKRAYEAFFLTWKDADPDLPMLVAGKQEYAAL